MTRATREGQAEGIRTMALPAQSQPQRILLIGNARGSVQELRKRLSSNGYECEVALDLETASSVVSERKMAAVVVDLDADGLTADAVLETFPGEECQEGLILFNGSSDSAVQRRYRRRGVDSYLSEKSGPDHVLRATDRAIGKTG